jgi:NAD(P)-dependent dehydrogenase (short-subunit alcohol dehydrogenase family)
MRIDGKVAVVTGAAVGTGRAIAQRLAAQGAEVVLADIDEAGLAQTADSIDGAARRVHVDLRDDDALAELMACRPQILVNNAGGGAVLRPCFPEADVGRWTASLELNLRAPMLATQLALQGMRAAGGGAIINLGSTAQTHNVRVNCVVPDWVATERGLAEQAALPEAERGPELVPLETLTSAVVRFVEDETLAGRVMLLDRGKDPELIAS